MIARSPDLYCPDSFPEKGNLSGLLEWNFYGLGALVTQPVVSKHNTVLIMAIFQVNLG